MQAAHNLSNDKNKQYQLLFLNALPKNKAAFAVDILKKADPHLQDLLMNLHDHPENLILFVDLWLNEITNRIVNADVNEILKVGKFLASNIKKTEFENLAPILHKQCTLQILLLLLKKIMPCAFDTRDSALLLVDNNISLTEKIKRYCHHIMARFAVDQLASALKDCPGANLTAELLKHAFTADGSKQELVSNDVKNFMKEHRNSFIHGGWGKTSSFKILDLLEQGKYKSAVQFLISEIEGFNEMLMKRLNLNLVNNLN